jgi:hypothetical protein
VRVAAIGRGQQQQNERRCHADDDAGHRASAIAPHAATFPPSRLAATPNPATVINSIRYVTIQFDSAGSMSGGRQRVERAEAQRQTVKIVVGDVIVGKQRRVGVRATTLSDVGQRRARAGHPSVGPVPCEEG